MLMTTPSLYAPFGLQKVDPTFDQQLLCQLLNVWQDHAATDQRDVRPRRDHGLRLAERLPPQPWRER